MIGLLMSAHRTPPAVVARVAGEADLDRLTDILATSFFDDPTWGQLLGEGERRSRAMAALLGFLTRSALRYPWVLISDAGESAAVWLPPGAVEMLPDEHEPFEQFEQAQPRQPHFYLSLLGTHDDSRGRGIGMGLLAENLRRIDALGMPAYLESTNPVNDARYARHGFEPVGSFTVPTGAVVTTMWRQPRDASAEPAAASPT